MKMRLRVIASFMCAIPSGITAAEMSLTIDAAARAGVIEGAVANLNELYIYPETAKKMKQPCGRTRKRAITTL